MSESLPPLCHISYWSVLSLTMPHPRLFSIISASTFVPKKRVLDEISELIQRYIPLEDVCTDQLEKGSVHQNSKGDLTSPKFHCMVCTSK